MSTDKGSIELHNRQISFQRRLTRTLIEPLVTEHRECALVPSLLYYAISQHRKRPVEVLRGHRSTNSRPINSENSDTQSESRERNGWKTVLKVGQGFGRRRRIIQARSPSLCSDAILFATQIPSKPDPCHSIMVLKKHFVVFSVMERYLYI